LSGPLKVRQRRMAEAIEEIFHHLRRIALPSSI
jgi:hypothetical protein